MKNIDKIKQNFIDAIKCMTVDQYNELNAVLCEECHYNQNLSRHFLVRHFFRYLPAVYPCRSGAYIIVTCF